MYNIAFCMYVNVCMYKPTHWKSLHKLCSWVWLRACHAFSSFQSLFVVKSHKSNFMRILSLKFSVCLSLVIPSPLRFEANAPSKNDDMPDIHNHQHTYYMRRFHKCNYKQKCLKYYWNWNIRSTISALTFGSRFI